MEQQQAWAPWAACNDTHVEYPGDRRIHDLFEEQARKQPEKTALIFNGRELSYAELNRRADLLAAHLRGLGAGPDAIAAISMERSLEMMVGLLAILKSGAAYLPLDPAFPAERLQFMLEDSGASMLLTESRLLGRFPLQPEHVVLVDSEPAGVQTEPRGSGAESHHLAYVMYTSGSTGKPKGVMVEHRNAVNFFTGMDRVLGPEPGVWLAVTSISFDISVLELFWTLTRGFTVVLQAESDRIGSGAEYSIDSQIMRHGVTHFQCTPSMARLLASSSGFLESLRGLRKLMLGGEALPAALVAQLRPHVAGDIFNLYGPTETTIWSGAYRVSGGERAVPIGRPIANTQFYILDETLQPVPAGELGELYIGGAGVARGYLNRPELTAEKFLANPFDSGRMYRTGDLVRYRPGGEVEFAGRVDNQVKILGFRIEPEEIEAALDRHPAVEAAAVVAQESASGEKKLAAYLVLRKEAAASVSELRAYLQQKLPPHMTPAAFTLLEGMPTTPNGKIDRKSLAARRASADDAAHPGKTRAELERLISGISREVLDLEDLGVEDRFFDVGATSLEIAEVAAKLGEALHRDIPLTDLFQYPTVAALALHLSGGGPQNAASRTDSQRGESRKRAMLRRAGTAHPNDGKTGHGAASAGGME